jgi:GDP-L-fucose synthase
MLGLTLSAAFTKHRPRDEVVGVDRRAVDLRDQTATAQVLNDIRPDLVIHAAAKVGGTPDKVAHPAQYLLDNLLVDTSVVRASVAAGVARLLYIGTAAFYPEAYDGPFVESDLLTGPLEKVNEPYALAKIAGARLCTYLSDELGVAYRVLVPSNLYGPFDHFGGLSSHLIGAALVKAHGALTRGEPDVEVWGDGTQRREFTYAPDLADWLALNVESADSWPTTLNLGVGTDHTVREYYEIACDVVGYRGPLRLLPDKPGGAAQRLLDSTLARGCGWAPTTPLPDGVAATYQSYLTSLGEAKPHV